MTVTQTVGGAAAGAGAGLTTLILGAQVDALVLGLCAAVFVSIWLEQIDSRIKAAAAVLFSAMFAAYGSPVAASYLVTTFPSFAPSAEPLRLFLVVAIGGAAPSIVPLSLRYLGRRIEGGKV